MPTKEERIVLWFFMRLIHIKPFPLRKISIEHPFGKRRLRFRRASLFCMACLDSDIPFLLLMMTFDEICQSAKRILRLANEMEHMGCYYAVVGKLQKAEEVRDLVIHSTDLYIWYGKEDKFFPSTKTEEGEGVRVGETCMISVPDVGTDSEQYIQKMRDRIFIDDPLIQVRYPTNTVIAAYPLEKNLVAAAVDTGNRV